MSHLSGVNTKVDRRHDRRALSVDEIRKLLDVTLNGPDVLGIAGLDRCVLYRIATETALRAGEIRSLTRASFDLNGTEPTVTVTAAYAKGRRTDTLPLRIETADMLRGHLAAKAPNAPAFRMPHPNSLIDMLRADLAAAGIEYWVDDLVFDFHGFRHTTGTWLAAQNVHPKVIQRIMRHSTITLTMDRYSHAYRADEAAAIAKLPDIGPSGRERVRATGTEDARPGDSVLADCLALREELTGVSVDSGGLDTPKHESVELAEKQGKTSVFERRRRDSNPRDAFTPNGFQDRRLQPLGHSSTLISKGLRAIFLHRPSWAQLRVHNLRSHAMTQKRGTDKPPKPLRLIPPTPHQRDTGQKDPRQTPSFRPVSWSMSHGQLKV